MRGLATRFGPLVLAALVAGGVPALGRAEEPSAPPDQPADGVEPPLGLRLEGLGAQPISVRLDEPFVVPAGATRSLVLRADLTRVFDRGFFRFRYPREFGFEFDASLDTWVLSGNDAKIMVHRIRVGDPRTLLAQYAKGVANELSPDGTEVPIGPVALRLGTREVGGLRLEGRVLSMRFRHDAVLFQTGGTTWILSVQDSLGEDGSASREASVIHDLLRTTFEIR